MFDIEIKYGLLQVSEGLAFLHDSAKMLHRNISPEAIVINEAGAWKICGFEYCLANSAGPGQEPSWSFPEYDHGQPPETYPQVGIGTFPQQPLIFIPILQLDYTAPEYALLGSVTPAADMFSFGMVAYAVFTRHAIISLFPCKILSINAGNHYSKITALGEFSREMLLNCAPYLPPDYKRWRVEYKVGSLL